MRILFLDTKANNPNRYISRAVFHGLRRDARVREVVWADYANALQVAMDGAFDAFVAFDGEEAGNPIVERLCALIPRRAIWLTEDPYEHYRNARVAALFDLVFTNDATTAAKYQGGAIHLPLAGDRNSHFLPVRQEAPRYDLFFAGSAWPNRLAFLSELRDRCPGVRLKLILVSNDSLTPYVEPFAQEFDFSNGISIRDFCRNANQSLLTLALPRVFSTDPANPDLHSDTPGPRLFEAALAGSCQLVDDLTRAQTSRLFDPDAHLIGYTSIDDCVEAIARAKSDPVGTRAIATAAQRHALTHHLYEDRASRIVTALGQLTERRRPAAPPRRPRVLLVAHNILAYGHFGGAETYLDEIVRGATEVDAFVLVPDRSKQPITDYVLRNAAGAEVERFTLGAPVSDHALVHPELELQFQRLLARHAFDIVHINHLIGFPPSLPHFARAYGARVVLSLHDYYVVCKRFNLIGIEQEYCAIVERPPHTCDVCLVRTEGIPPGSQARRRRFMREALEHLDAVLVGSSASADILTGMYPRLRDRVVRLSPPISRPSPAPVAARDGNTLKVALLGNFTQNKGGHTALEIFRGAASLPIVFHIFGRVDPELEPALRELAPESVRAHGPFEPGRLPDALLSCQVGLFLSPWPETYCITLSEAQMLRLVPIVTALGAQVERVSHGRNGFHVPVNDSGAVLAALRQLLDAPELVHRMQEEQPAPAGATSAEFLGELTAIYRNLMADRPALAAIDEVRRSMTLDELGVVLSFPRWMVDAAGPPPAARIGNAEPDAIAAAFALRMQHATRLGRFLMYLWLAERPVRFLLSIVRRQVDRIPGARRLSSSSRP